MVKEEEDGDDDGSGGDNGDNEGRRRDITKTRKDPITCTIIDAGYS